MRDGEITIEIMSLYMHIVLGHSALSKEQRKKIAFQMVSVGPSADMDVLNIVLSYIECMGKGYGITGRINPSAGRFYQQKLGCRRRPVGPPHEPTTTIQSVL